MKKTSNFLTTARHLNFIKILLTDALQFFVKPLSKVVTFVLKLMYKQIQAYESKSDYFSEV